MDFKSLIRPYFRGHAYVGRSLIFFDEIHSTNLFLLENQELLKINALVVHAKKQTRGIGRKGRKWEQGDKEHLFCSFVIHHQNKRIKTISSYPLIIGLCVYDALKGLNCKNLSLKWPNDVLLNGKKVSGILCQSRPLSDGKTVVIAGIGVNIGGSCKQFSNELKNKATTLEEHGIKISANKLLAEITKALESIFSQIEHKGMQYIFNRWEKASNSIGCKIKFIEDGKELYGKILGLDDIGRLRVLHLESSKVYIVESGEIDFKY